MKAPRILLVEDSPTDVELTREVFAGAAIDVVADGESALAHLRREARPDLVLLDLNLPRMGGLEVLRGIRADPALTALTVVVLTTSRSADDDLASHQAGADAFLTKPHDLAGFEALARSIQQTWLGGYTF